jgi:DNA invertase Pin-like site-specific DNA recombinase
MGRGDNAGESDSIGNQRKQIYDWLKNHPEIEVVNERVDDGYSGILFDRPAFTEMMEDIKAGKIDCCLTKDLSRLGREFVETGRYLRRIFPAYGVRFIAINDNIDTLNDSGDDLAVSLKSIINDAYCRDVSIKTRSALNAKRGNGDYVGAFAVYGYKKSDENHNQLVIDEFAARYVRDIFRMKVNGMSALRISDTLNEQGVLSPLEYRKDRGLPYPKNNYCDRDGAKWSPTTVIRILSDETYVGTLTQGVSSTPNYKLKERITKPADEWKRCEDAHEPIIKRAQFDLVQKILRLDTRTAPDGDSVYLFSGVLICGTCGSRMTRYNVPAGGKKYYYYRCPSGKKGGCNHTVRLKESTLINGVLESVRAHIANIASLESLIESLDADRVARELAEKLRSQLAENERRLDKIREFKASLYENMVGGNLSKDEYKALKSKYTADADGLVAADERLKQEIDDALSCKHERLAWTRHFTEFSNLEAIDRKTVVNLISAIRVLSKTEIEINFNFQTELDTVLALLAEGRTA